MNYTPVIGGLLASCAIAIACAAAAAPWPASEGTLKAQGSPELPKQGRFLMRHVYGNHADGAKVARMLQYKLVKLGYMHDTKQPDLVVTFGFDVFRPDLNGESQVVSVFDNLPKSAFVFDPAAPYRTPADERLFTDTRRIFTHTLEVRISRTQDGGTLWQGVVTESGWCSTTHLFAPRMVNLMFSGFPDATASSRALAENGDAERELMGIFPQGLTWDCLTVWHGRLPPRSGL